MPQSRSRTARKGPVAATSGRGAIAMQAYGNAAGDSGVVAYALEPRAIVVEFANGSIYRYTVRSAGAVAVREMQGLAQAGRGLSTYISQHAREAYAERLD
jgi:hypothetical protein